jgi:glycosyltransferase involved in cell wall biosynthesis
MRELVIDVRKMFDSGIGTYVRNVVPRVVHRFGDYRVSLIGQRTQLSSQMETLHLENVQWLAAAAKPFTALEQRELRSFLGESSTFWATSLAHPLFTGRHLIATVHDVAQLALPNDLGGSALVRSIALQYFRSLRQRASLLLCVSEFTRSELERKVGVRPHTDVKVTPLGVDNSWFLDSPSARPTELPARYFVVVGNLKPHKNLHRVLQAFRSVMDELPQDLVIIGKHEGFRTADPGILASIRSLGDRVHFLGSVHDVALKPTMASAEALVFASLYEGFGLPALEAAAAGCIVVTSRTGATPQICERSGIFIDPESVDSIRSALKEVNYMTSTERQARTQLARTRASEFTWDRTADLTTEAIHSAFGSSERRG